MTKHDHTVHIDKFRIGHPERQVSGFISGKAIGTLWRWLPMIGAEAMLLASFLLWLEKNNPGYHGLALGFAWVVYGLVALSFARLWIEPPEEGSGRHP